jgi:hypothetical protein
MNVLKIQDCRVLTSKRSIVVTAVPKRWEGATQSWLGGRARCAFRFPQFVDNLRRLHTYFSSSFITFPFTQTRGEPPNRIFDIKTLHELKFFNTKMSYSVPPGKSRLDRSGPAPEDRPLLMSEVISK